MRITDIFEADLGSVVKRIAADNQIADPNRIMPGQRLRMPSGTEYTVKPGDTLWKIAGTITSPQVPPSTIRTGPNPNIGQDTRQRASAVAAAAPRPGPNANIGAASRQKAQQQVDSQAITDIVKSGPGFIDVKTADGQILRRQGNANWRMNNPGNLRPSPWTKQQPGFVGVGDAGPSGQFAVFATLEDGLAAKKKLLFDPRSKYYNLSIADAITRYAPPSDNNPTDVYIKSIVQATQAAPDTPLNRLSSHQQDSMLAAINKMEGFKVGQVTALSQQPLTADIHQPANPKDTVELDVPLLLRMLEFAREDADTDMDLHNVTDRMIELSQDGQSLDMNDYNEIVNEPVDERFQLPKHLFTKKDRFKSLRREAIGGSSAENLIKDIEYHSDQNNDDDDEEVKEGHGRYWCSTDKRWKDRKGPKQSRS